MIYWKAQSSNRASASLARVARLLWCVAALSACDDGSSSPREDGSTEPVTPPEGGVDDADSEDTGAEDTGAAQDDDGALPDGGELSDATSPEPDVLPPGTPCDSDEDCEDDLYCNGQEKCEPASGGGAKVCKPGLPLDCPREHPCMEEQRACDCRNPDFDNDGDGAEICAGNQTQLLTLVYYKDCDDGDRARCSRNKEQCDARDVDEDCNAETFGERDQDGDGYKDATCRNWDKQGKPRGGDDCNDHDPAFHPRALEICDYFDNNCNGFVDERRLPDGLYEQKDGGLRELLLPDRDRDGHGQAGVEPTLLCNVTEKEGLVVATATKDCDDTDPLTYVGAEEICDGSDNDCDGKVDADDAKDADSEGLQLKFSFPGTKVSCVGGLWKILEGDCPNDDVQWCDGRDPIEQGCRSDATRLSSCRACNTDCDFSCGAKGCDEIVQLSAGGEHACARTAEGQVACWGRGQFGILGNGGTNSASTPQLLDPPLVGVTELAAGINHTCAVADEERHLYCWGNNDKSQLGSPQSVAEGSFTTRYVAVAAGGTVTLTPGNTDPILRDVRQVGLGLQHTCALLGDGTLTCWGAQADGRLANGEFDDTTKPSPVLAFNEDFDTVQYAVALAVGDRHGCIVTRSGTVECWGDNGAGQLGRDPATLPMSEITLAVPGLQGVTAIAAGSVHTCALADGLVYCWGDNTFRQLGRLTDATHRAYEARVVEGISDAEAVFAGRAHNCALGTDKRLRCWGANNRSQLSTQGAQGSSVLTPVLVPVSDVRTAALGSEYSCVLSGATDASCWGYNAYGQLGNGQTRATGSPSIARVRSLSGSSP